MDKYMSFNDEKNQYISKLNHISDGITKILEIKNNKVVTSEMVGKLIKLKEQANILLLKLEKGEFEIAVVGLEKAGKSSFSNALIGLTALPTDQQRCTYTSTCIRDGQQSAADVWFYTRQEFDRDLYEKLAVLQIPNAELYNIDTLSREEYERLFSNCPDWIQEKYKNTLNRDIVNTLEHKDELKRYIGGGVQHFSEQQLSTDEFREFITSPAKAIAVKDVTIYSTKLTVMPNAVMYDVPGFNSPTAMHQEQTEQKMQSADAIIMVAKADEPSITGDVLSVFKKSDVDGSLLSEKLFIFANKADRAEDLKKNMTITYQQWIDEYKILNNTEESRSRIIFGSANAHLGDSVPFGAKARAGLEELGITDGIDELRNKLTEYYNTTRFEVLKKRIDKIIFDVQNLFEGTKGNYVQETSSAESMEYNMIILNLYKQVESTLKGKLRDLKDKVNKEAREDSPLTAEIANCIGELITEEKYSIQDDEVESVHKEIAGISSAEQPQKLDGNIREKRFTIMYGDFADQVLNCTSTQHSKVCDSIVNIFMDALKINEVNKEYTRIKEEVIELGKLNDKNSETYYQSLIERFARDLFEIFIKFSHGADRLNKFKEEAVNLFSLGVFYNASTAADKEGKELSYINDAPKDSPLWKVLLYPEYATMDSKHESLERLKQLTGIQNIGESIDKMLDSLAAIKGSDAVKVLEGAFEKFVLTNSEAAKVALIKEVLARILEDPENDSSTLLASVLTENRYLSDVAEKHQEYSYKIVQKEFSDDISALQIVLQKAFIPAVNMDKAFSARETKVIEDMIKVIDSDAFSEFIARNVDTIESAKLDVIKQNEAQRSINIAVMKEINKILDSITTTVALQ